MMGYKSGAKVHLKMDNLTFKYGTTREISWDGADPPIIYIGVDDISAIFMGHV